MLRGAKQLDVDNRILPMRTQPCFVSTSGLFGNSLITSVFLWCRSPASDIPSLNRSRNVGAGSCFKRAENSTSKLSAGFVDLRVTSRKMLRIVMVFNRQCRTERVPVGVSPSPTSSRVIRTASRSIRRSNNGARRNCSLDIDPVCGSARHSSSESILILLIPSHDKHLSIRYGIDRSFIIWNADPFPILGSFYRMLLVPPLASGFEKVRQEPGRGTFSFLGFAFHCTRGKNGNLLELPSLRNRILGVKRFLHSE